MPVCRGACALRVCLWAGGSPPAALRIPTAAPVGRDDPGAPPICTAPRGPPCPHGGSVHLRTRRGRRPRRPVSDLPMCPRFSVGRDDPGAPPICTAPRGPPCPHGGIDYLRTRRGRRPRRPVAGWSPGLLGSTIPSVTCGDSYPCHQGSLWQHPVGCTRGPGARPRQSSASRPLHP